MSKIRCGCCHQTHDTVADVRVCYASKSREAPKPSHHVAETAALFVHEIDGLGSVDLVEVVVRGVDSMPSTRHPDVVRRGLGLGDAPPMTLAVIGDQLGV